MATTAETLALQAQLDAQVAAVVDQQARAMTAAWVAAWATVAGELQATVTQLLEDAASSAGAVVSVLPRAVLLRSVRMTRHLADINDRLRDLTAGAADTILADADRVVTDAVRAQRGIIASQLPQPGDDADAARLADDLLGVDVTALASPSNDRALQAIVTRTRRTVTARTRPLVADTQRVVRRELVRGVAVGENPRAVAARIVANAHRGFNGGLTRALVISRTELLDAHREAAQVGQDAHRDVLDGWEWFAHLDGRVCGACLAKHGTRYASDVPGPQGHPQCRCARRPAVKPWDDLGLDVPEPAPLGITNSRAWFDDQPLDVRSRILGPARLRLLDDGLIDWDDLAVLHRNPGWRDAWHVRTVRDLTGIAAQRSAAA